MLSLPSFESGTMLPHFLPLAFSEFGYKSILIMKGLTVCGFSRRITFKGVSVCAQQLQTAFNACGIATLNYSLIPLQRSISSGSQRSARLLRVIFSACCHRTLLEPSHPASALPSPSRLVPIVTSRAEDTHQEEKWYSLNHIERKRPGRSSK